MCAFICYSTCEHGIWKRIIDVDWHKWYIGQGMKHYIMGQEVKGQGHTRSVTDLEALRRHYSWPREWSGFSSLYFLSALIHMHVCSRFLHCVNICSKLLLTYCIHCVSYSWFPSFLPRSVCLSVCRIHVFCQNEWTYLQNVATPF